MILFSSTKLEAALAKGELGDWDKTKYLLLSVVLMALLAPAAALIRPHFGPVHPPWNMFFALCGAVLAARFVYVGIKRCFEINRTIDGDRFIERFTVLFVPITIRVMIVVVPLSIAANRIVAGRREANPMLYRLYFPVTMSLTAPLVMALYYWLLARSLERLGNRMAGDGADL